MPSPSPEFSLAIVAAFGLAQVYNRQITRRKPVIIAKDPTVAKCIGSGDSSHRVNEHFCDEILRLLGDRIPIFCVELEMPHLILVYNLF